MECTNGLSFYTDKQKSKKRGLFNRHDLRTCNALGIKYSFHADFYQIFKPSFLDLNEMKFSF